MNLLWLLELVTQCSFKEEKLIIISFAFLIERNASSESDASAAKREIHLDSNNQSSKYNNVVKLRFILHCVLKFVMEIIHKWISLK